MSKIRSVLGRGSKASLSNLSAELRRKAYLSDTEFGFENYNLESVNTSGSVVYTITDVYHARYCVIGQMVIISVSVLGTTSGAGAFVVRLTLPFAGWGPTDAVGTILSEGQGGACSILDGTERKGLWRIQYNQNFIEINRHDLATWGIGTGRAILLNLTYMRN
jgi:hypothetical protein